MAGNNTGNIRQYKKPLNINLGMIFFSVIFIYILICVVMYLTSSSIAGYQVKTGSLFVDNIYTGLALRQERLITSDHSGYLNHYVREGNRIGAYKMVCTVDEGGRLQDIMEEQSMGTNSLSEKDLNALRSDIIDFSKDFDAQRFVSAYDFKASIEGNVLNLANSNILDNLESLNRSGESGLINICNSPVSGIVVYSYDGYEDFKAADVTEDILSQKDYVKTSLIANELVSAGEPIYKLITDEDWSIIIETDAERADYLLEMEYVQVKFLRTQTVSWAEVRSFTNSDGDHFVELIFNNSMITFCTDRFIEIELILEEEEGLKVPNSAIAEKEFYMVPQEYVRKDGASGEMSVSKQIYDEDGNQTTKSLPVNIYNLDEDKGIYYLESPELELGDILHQMDSQTTHTIKDKGSLLGVYNKNKGYADFKQIQVLYENEEYSIIKSNTAYGLVEYDYIVLDAEAVSEDELLN